MAWQVLGGNLTKGFIENHICENGIIIDNLYAKQKTLIDKSVKELYKHPYEDIIINLDINNIDNDIKVADELDKVILKYHDITYNIQTHYKNLIKKNRINYFPRMIVILPLLNWYHKDYLFNDKGIQNNLTLLRSKNIGVFDPNKTRVINSNKVVDAEKWYENDHLYQLFCAEFKHYLNRL